MISNDYLIKLTINSIPLHFEIDLSMNFVFFKKMQRFVFAEALLPPKCFQLWYADKCNSYKHKQVEIMKYFYFLILYSGKGLIFGNKD